MKKPSLIVVTGSPASGKTTLASILTSKINCPLISRDQLKEGYINTLKMTHNQLDNSVDWYIYNVFFDAIDLFISKGISIIIEATATTKITVETIVNAPIEKVWKLYATTGVEIH